MELADWIAAYGRAWEEGDPEAVVALFTEDASYRSSPFREPNLGHDGIRAYWRAAGTQEAVQVRMGEPVVDRNVVAVEWWTTMDDPDDGEITLPGCLLLQFAPDGRCFDLREYWNVEGGLLPPHDGWGSWRRG
jgi:ketosteroid isomerase-like protein